VTSEYGRSSARWICRRRGGASSDVHEAGPSIPRTRTALPNARVVQPHLSPSTDRLGRRPGVHVELHAALRVLVPCPRPQRLVRPSSTVAARSRPASRNEHRRLRSVRASTSRSGDPYHEVSYEDLAACGVRRDAGPSTARPARTSTRRLVRSDEHSKGRGAVRHGHPAPARRSVLGKVRL